MKDIVISGYAGAIGTKEIINTYMDELANIYSSSYIEEITNEYERYGNPVDVCLYDDCDIIPAEDRGVLCALYELAVKSKSGMQIRIKRIPILQSTIEICERYEINPYRLLSDCIVATTDNGEQLVERLTSQGIIASRIGVLTSGLDKIIIDKQEPEYINRPTQDEIEKIRRQQQ